MTDSPITGATADGARSGVPEDRLLLILAVDHRASLERDLYGLTAPPSPAQAARISADKLLVYQALLDAAGQLPADVQPGVLIDEQYGASVAELAARTGGAVSKLEHWLQVAAPVPGWVGFAIGRSIWQDPLHAHLHHHCTAGEARRQITNAYLDYARYYRSARDDKLDAAPDPEFW